MHLHGGLLGKSEIQSKRSFGHIELLLEILTESKVIFEANEQYLYSPFSFVHVFMNE